MITAKFVGGPLDGSTQSLPRALAKRLVEIRVYAVAAVEIDEDECDRLDAMADAQGGRSETGGCVVLRGNQVQSSLGDIASKMNAAAHHIYTLTDNGGETTSWAFFKTTKGPPCRLDMLEARARP